MIAMPRLERVRTEVARTGQEQRVWKTSFLEEEYPDEYKDLFFEPQKKFKKPQVEAESMKSAGGNRRSLGQRVRLGFD